ncbi:PDR/VanB family oxidoreductase [Pseudonocardia bannensis]|uniref:Oxidoreductase n=1 Tax=Pseudonocardia bannensis TaxID=630973 RepID=A0A848DDS5_9PSEU|nr:PDR/VanB family oxidoreductase [Pseudonocardia bannensis]NMH90723.1 oxidoreductase [Pseudonocardia bannensis]
MMRGIDAVVAVSARLAQRSVRRRPAVAAVHRDLALVVTEVRDEAPEVVGLRLARGSGGPLPPWHPGAHLDVVLPSGRVRQYSLCGDPADRTAYRIAVRRLADGAGGSMEVHALRPGTPVVVRGPRTAFPLVSAPAYLFLAGGIGITPILPMVRAAAARGADWRLVHTGRDRASLPLSPGATDLDPTRVWLRPDDENGGPPAAADLLAGLPGGAAVYCCGPPPMIDAVRRAVPAGHAFHAERFSPPPVLGGRPFTLELARRGRVVEVPADGSALDAVRAVAPDVAFSCRQGFCGTCHVRVLEGEPADGHSAPGKMALCVARAAGDRVVLDL